MSPARQILARACGAGYLRFLDEGVFRTGVPAHDAPPLGPLAERVRREGPQPYARLVEASLFGEGGYYTENVRFSEIGAAGGPAIRDFITCPEITPLFGASFVRPFATLLERSAAGRGGDPWPVYELGAGTGAFARAFLEALRYAAPALWGRLHYCIVEVSEALAARQRRALDDAFPGGHPVRWVRASAGEVEVPEEALVFSNEMLDVWPFERVVRQKGRLRQLFVGIEDGFWVERWADPTPEVEAFAQRHVPGLVEGVEEPLLLSTVPLLERLAAGIQRGALCFVDYGGMAPLGAALLEQAHVPDDKRFPVRIYGGLAGPLEARRRAIVEAGGYPLGRLVYEEPGALDITCSVDFGVLRSALEAAGGWHLRHCGPQGRFLLRAGLADAALRERERIFAASSFAEVRRRAAALGLAAPLLAPELSDWFFVAFATRGLDDASEDALLTPDAACPSTTAAGDHLESLWWTLALERLALEVDAPDGPVIIESAAGPRTADLTAGHVEVRLGDLAGPGTTLRITRANTPLFDLDRPSDQSRALQALRQSVSAKGR